MTDRPFVNWGEILEYLIDRYRKDTIPYDAVLKCLDAIQVLRHELEPN